MKNSFQLKYLALIYFFFLIVNLFGQPFTIWNRHPANPVLDIGNHPAWDDSFAAVSAVIYHDNFYRMWYEGNDENGIGYATSSNGIIWIRDSANPVLTHGPDSAWHGGSISNASVVYAEGMYKMWYMGLDTTHDSRIGLATSLDGIVWTEESSNPVVNLGNVGDWDSEEAMHPWVIYENGIYKMYYNGHDGLMQRILYAWSIDGILWNKHTAHPMLEPGAPGQWDENEIGPMCVVNRDSMYHMWYMGWNFTNVYQIGHATSPDGLTWSKDTLNPVFTAGEPGEWDDTGVAVPSVIWNDSVCYMWYGGFDGTFGRTGLAGDFIDGINSEKPIKIPANIILHQNYPNPFNPVTTIHYRLPKSNFITLKVYDVLGKEVATLVSDKQLAKEYRIDWNAANYPSGLYYYTLKSENEIKVGKMLLLK